MNGSNGAVGPVLALSGAIPADGFFVVADDRGDGASDVANVDLVLNFDFQNGPDSSVRRDSTYVHQWRLTFTDDGLRDERDSTGVHCYPLISSP